MGLKKICYPKLQKKATIQPFIDATNRAIKDMDHYHKVPSFMHNDRRDSLYSERQPSSRLNHLHEENRYSDSYRNHHSHEVERRDSYSYDSRYSDRRDPIRQKQYPDRRDLNGYNRHFAKRHERDFERRDLHVPNSRHSFENDYKNHAITSLNSSSLDESNTLNYGQRNFAKLKELKELLDMEAITLEEFEAQKAQLLRTNRY